MMVIPASAAVSCHMAVDCPSCPSNDIRMDLERNTWRDFSASSKCDDVYSKLHYIIIRSQLVKIAKATQCYSNVLDNFDNLFKNTNHCK